MKRNYFISVSQKEEESKRLEEYLLEKEIIKELYEEKRIKLWPDDSEQYARIDSLEIAVMEAVKK